LAELTEQLEWKDTFITARSVCVDGKTFSDNSQTGGDQEYSSIPRRVCCCSDDQYISSDGDGQK